MKKIAYISDNKTSKNLDSLNHAFEVASFEFSSLNRVIGNESHFHAIIIDAEEFAEISTEKCPVFFVNECLNERVSALKKGAFDVISPSIDREELIFKINFGMKLFGETRSQFALGRLKMDLSTLQVYLDDKRLELTLIEMKLALHLINLYPRIVSRDEIVSLVWSDQYVSKATLNTHFTNLRIKLIDWEYKIASVKNSGFYLARKSLEEVILR